jgi:hypothetical protein
VSLLAFFARRFWNTCVRQNENQLTPAGIYVSLLHSGVSSIYATAGEAAFRLLARTHEFSRFSSGSKLNRSPQCTSPFSLSDGTKIKIIFETSKKKHKKNSEAAGFGGYGGVFYLSL